jgi:hypothetical protein
VGEGCIVQIDEALLVRIRYNVGRMGQQPWVFAHTMLQKKRFLITVPNRNAETLMGIIRKEYIQALWLFQTYGLLITLLIILVLHI